MTEILTSTNFGSIYPREIDETCEQLASKGHRADRMAAVATIIGRRAGWLTETEFAMDTVIPL